MFVVDATLAYARGRGAATAAWFLVVLPCIHIAWGTGFVLGYLSLTSNIASHTGR
jgi:succinoglycan biosynthesis protein ExoA